MPLRFQYECPRCGTQLRFHSRITMRRRRCPQCGLTITVAEIDRQEEDRHRRDEEEYEWRQQEWDQQERLRRELAANTWTSVGMALGVTATVLMLLIVATFCCCGFIGCLGSV